MIPGFVNEFYDPMVPLSVRGSTGNKQTIVFQMDTGFNGALTLTPAQIRELDLVYLTRTTITLANGAKEEVEVYTAFVEWDGRLRNVYVEAASTDPVLGMRLLREHDVFVEAVIGGKVTITARP